MPTDVGKEVLDVKEAAEYLRVSTEWVYRKAREGKIGTRLGELWRFPISQLRDYANGRLPWQIAERGASNEQIQAGNS